MPTTIYSCTLAGLKCSIVEIETHLSRGLPSFSIVGLADTSIQESKERVRSALISSFFEFPLAHKTVNLAPAHIKKCGSMFDLPIAVGILGASNQIELSRLKDVLVIGELSLDGSVKPLPGILVVTEFARANGFKVIILPAENFQEAQMIKGIEIWGIQHLKELKNIENLSTKKTTVQKRKLADVYTKIITNFSDIYGQEHAKRALTIAAAGGHHLLLQGPPGCGKTLMAKSFSGILPPLTFKEKIEVSRIYSLKGMLKPEEPLIEERPFRTVHHSASALSLVGGGALALPGEISLAHKGVLFLDEIAEFPRNVLEFLRQPLESGKINVSRAAATYEFPAAFQLIATMNPCPCGYFGHPVKACTCAIAKIENYQRKISGPIKDRIDLQLQVHPVQKISNSIKTSSSKEIKLQVEKAFFRQQKRFTDDGISCNGQMTQSLLKKYVKCTRDANMILKQALSKLNLSLRGYSKLLKVSLTIADLETVDVIKESHVLEALSYREN